MRCVMLDIAQHGGGSPVRIKDIAARQGISVKYLEQIVAVLARAGYLKSIRGPQGGYRLVRNPEEYTTGSILRLTEGSLAPVECLEGPVNDCPRADSCATLRLWKELDNAVKSVVDRYTLQDLLNWSEEAGSNFVI